MKRFPKVKGINETLTDRQRARMFLLSKHSKRSLTVALSIVTTHFTKSEMDHLLGLLAGIDEATKAERDYKILKRYGAAL